MVKRYKFVMCFCVAYAMSALSSPLRDPTQPLPVSRGNSGDTTWVLQAIIKRNGQRTVLINGVSLKIGDIEKSMTLLDIDKTFVTIEENGQVKRLYLRRSIR